MTNNRIISNPLRTLQTMRQINGTNGKVSATDPIKRNVVERIHHQLFQEESWAYGFVRARRLLANCIGKLFELRVPQNPNSRVKGQ